VDLMVQTEEEIRSYINLGENIQRGEDIPEEVNRRDNPKNSPFRQDLLYTRKEVWDEYKAYTTSAQTTSGKRDREKERDPNGIYSTDR
jgi:hypothetical protein